MKRILLLTCIFSFLVLLNLSQAVEVDVIPSYAETYVNEQAWYTINIHNDKYRADEFVITVLSVLGSKLEWLSLESGCAKLEDFESIEVEMYFYPKLENSYEYEVLVYSNTNNEDRDSDTISLEVFPERLVRLLDFSSEVVGDNLEIQIELLSKHKRDVEINFEIFDSSRRIVKYLEITREIEGKEEITETIPLDDLLAGNYELRMNIPEHDISDEANFYIIPVHSVVKKKEIVSTPFGQEVTITIKNEGNVVEDYNIREAVPSNQYVDIVDEPTSSYLEGDDVSYNWRIEGLMVGATGRITYKISRLPLIIGSLVVLLCVIALLGMGVVRVRTPNIKKRYVRKRGEHLIVIEIKGSFTKELRNVLVKDRVSPLGRVVPEFEGPKPIVREGEAGTELIWRLGDIRPRSEIYLTYRIRPLIEAQLKMPRAYLTYRTDDDRKIRVFSKQLLLE